MRVYAISGLGADKRVYEDLKLNISLTHLEWIKPLKNESLPAYSKRLSKTINTSEPFGIIGLSFGGIIAIEISKKLNPNFTLLISSVETKYELRTIYRWFGKLNLIRIFPEFCFNMPRSIGYYFFGAKNKKLLKAILDDTNLYFTKWAINQISRWENTTRIDNIIKINGTKDKLIPPKNYENSVLIKGGGHFMIIDKANEVSKKINSQISLYL
jgi:hypothetical protein